MPWFPVGEPQCTLACQTGTEFGKETHLIFFFFFGLTHTSMDHRFYLRILLINTPPIYVVQHRILWGSHGPHKYRFPSHIWVWQQPDSSFCSVELRNYLPQFGKSHWFVEIFPFLFSFILTRIVMMLLSRRSVGAGWFLSFPEVTLSFPEASWCFAKPPVLGSTSVLKEMPCLSQHLARVQGTKQKHNMWICWLCFINFILSI